MVTWMMIPEGQTELDCIRLLSGEVSVADLVREILSL